MLSVGGGITLFLVTKDEIHSPSLADLVNNIAASLLSIPFVFLLYDYSNYRVSRKLNKNMTSNMSAQVGSLMLGIIMVIRNIIGLRGGQMTLESINKMGGIDLREISRRINKITPKQVEALKDYHAELQRIVYQYAQDNVMGAPVAADLSALGLDMLHMINQTTFHGDKKRIAKYIADIIVKITDWMDSDAGMKMNFAQLLAQANENKPTAK